jgi:hypothetical protein
MTDTREAILARLLVILATIDGVAGSGATKAIGRNITDVPAGWSDRRPAIFLHDGIDEFLDAPRQHRTVIEQRRQLTPLIVICAGADAKDIGTLLNTFLARLQVAVLGDTELRSLVDASKPVHFQRVETIPAGPEAREGRMEVTFVINYILNANNLP